MYQEIITSWWQAFLNWVIHSLPSIIITLVLCFLILKAYKLLLNKVKTTVIKKSSEKTPLEKEENEKRINTLMNIIRQTGNLIILAVFITIILGKLGVEVGPILASAGILGLAVGFGAQELVRDIISGFFILLENQLRTGDVGIINGTAGLVEKIELRTITLRDFSGVVHVFQNGKINTLSNMTKEWSAIVLDVGVAYDSDVDEVIQIMKEVGDEMQADPEFTDFFKEPIAVMGLDQFGSSALIIRARIQTKPISQWMIGREYRRRLKKVFDQKGINIPFPQTTITWGNNAKPENLD